MSEHKQNCATRDFQSKKKIALRSHLLARRNMAPNIKNLVGQLEFTSMDGCS
jgi:hypothetical protein